MSIKEKIGLITLGCSKNTVDSERLLNQLKENSFEIVDDPNDSDTLIVNTCGFIKDAKEESINTILTAAELKKEQRLKRLIVFGCLSERYKEDLLEEIPEVDVFFGVEEYEKIVNELNGKFEKELISDRVVTTPPHYAYLKISEGCNNPCSFCAIPLIRGKHKSLPTEQVEREAASLVAKGVKELNVIAQDTTYYGLDLYKKRSLAELLNKITQNENLEWIRLLYTYPRNFPLDVLDEMRDNPKICKYIDMPLQHISDNVLKSMKRGITSKETRELIYKIKETVPGIALRTTFIVGYPNETEEDFAELLDFIEEMKFDRVGAFAFSPEEDTTSFELGDPISEEVKQERLASLMELQSKISLEKNEKRIGSIEKILIDSLEGDYYIGRSQFETAEVDGEILIPSTNNLKIGSFYDLEIVDCNEYDLYAKIPD
ncbi:MAG: 30S ribosomal protein S12 methylthiotransferase RimO [Rhodothermaceae bacterium]